MFMFSMFTSLLVYFAGVYVSSSKQKYLLMVLLSLEYIVLSLFMLIIIFLIEFDYDYFFPVIFLVFSVCEGVVDSVFVLMVMIFLKYLGLSFKVFIYNYFMFLLCFLNNCWWLVHSLMFMSSFGLWFVFTLMLT